MSKELAAPRRLPSVLPALAGRSHGLGSGQKLLEVRHHRNQPQFRAEGLVFILMDLSPDHQVTEAAQRGRGYQDQDEGCPRSHGEVPHPVRHRREAGLRPQPQPDGGVCGGNNKIIIVTLISQ